MTTATPQYIRLKKAAELTGGRFSAPSLYRLAREGKLKALKSGRGRFTTREWLDEFLATYVVEPVPRAAKPERPKLRSPREAARRLANL